MVTTLLQELNYSMWKFCPGLLISLIKLTFLNFYFTFKFCHLSVFFPMFILLHLPTLIFYLIAFNFLVYLHMCLFIQISSSHFVLHFLIPTSSLYTPHHFSIVPFQLYEKHFNFLVYIHSNRLSQFYPTFVIAIYGHALYV